MQDFFSGQTWMVKGWPVWANNLLVLLIIAILSITTGLLLVYILKKTIRKIAGKTGRFIFYHHVLQHWSLPIAVFVPLLISHSLIGNLTVSEKVEDGISKMYSILFTISVSWLIIKAIYIVEAQILSYLNLNKDDNLRERKMLTQLQFIKRILIGIIVLLTISIIFIHFDDLRQLGDTLLKSVGIGSIIIGFAAQKSLANLMAGFQIAFTQPLRIDDVLLAEGEWGRVEEITLTYVVLKVWDERRLILPINYFIEKPFQNWTRNNSSLLGTVFLYTDFSMPVAPVREEFTRLLEASPDWDKRVNVVHVTDLSNGQMEIRLLMSAKSSPVCFELRAYVRERIIAFVNVHYPEHLIRTRVEMVATGNEKEPEQKEGKAD